MSHSHARRRLFVFLVGALVIAAAILAVAGPALAAPSTSPSLIMRVQQNDPAVVYTGRWLTVKDPAASGGSYAVANPLGPSATAVVPSVTFHFTGTSVAWIAQKGPAGGLARVLLDGKNMGLVSLFSPRVLWQQRAWYSGFFAPKAHTLTISWTGLRMTAIPGTQVNVDAFDVTIGTVVTP